MANVNFTLVSDNGSPLGVSGNQQNDCRFGDIRIGGYAMSSSILAFAYLAPPANGGTNAGDMFFNTTQSWQINGTTYDLMTVAIHEFGHAIGMGHSTDSTAAMYPAYITTKQAVNTDDTQRHPNDLQFPPERLLRRQRRPTIRAAPPTTSPRTSTATGSSRSRRWIPPRPS